jgi:glutathione S-transferase
LPLLPGHGAARWRALKFQAMGDGILDASVPRRWEMLKPAEAGRTAWITRQKAAVDRTLQALEADPPHRMLDIGSIAVACALGYLDFRFAAEPWRPACPKLAAWFAAFGENPGIAGTVPT